MKRATTFFTWLRHFLFKGNIATTKQATDMGLTHETNIYGDMINWTGCRSFWNDAYGRRYLCDHLLPDGKDMVMDQLKRDHPEFFES